MLNDAFEDEEEFENTEQYEPTDDEVGFEPEENPEETGDDAYEPTVVGEFGLVSYLLASPDVWVRALPLLKPDYFSNEFRTVIDFAIKWSEKYKKLPSPLIVRTQTGVKLETPEDSQDERVMRWLCDEIEGHCRHKAACKLLVESSLLANKKESMTRAATAHFQDEWKKINLMSMTRHLGVEVHDNMAAALQRAKDNSGIACGLTHLDRILGGGFNRKSLNLFVMGSGGGKSVMLANLAFNYARIHKFNVVYVTLELDEELTQTRFASIMTGTPTGEVFGRKNDIDKELKIRMLGPDKKEGHIYLKKMPMSGTTCADIEAYMHDLMVNTGLTFQVLIVDYLDLLAPKVKGLDLNKEHLKDKACTEELRSLCDEYNMIGFTASQRTKGSEDDDANDSQGHVAGGSTKVNTVDNLIFGRRSDRDREEGKMWLTSKKSRTSSAHGKRFPVRFDNNTLVISDASEDEFANALPYLSVKDLTKQSPIEKRYQHVVPRPKQDVNKGAATTSKAIQSFMRGQRAGTAA